MTVTASIGSGVLSLDPRHLLVVVAPHPDDEVIAFGGAIYDHVSAGGRTLIVAVTDGGAFDDRATPAQRLAAEARRRAEQVAALAVLGVSESAVVRIGIPDGAIAASIEELAGYLRGLLSSAARNEAALVVTPWRHDGHPDHESTTAAVLCLDGIEAWEVPIWSWQKRQEATWRQLELPISTAARAAKRAALRCYESQLAELPGNRPPILSSSFVEDFDRSVEVVVR